MKSSLITKIVTSKKTFLLTLISFLLSLQRQKKRMKRYKVIEVIKMLLDDGWEYCYTKGDHRQFKHPTKPGKVTVRGKDSETLDQFNLNSIWKQANWK